MNKYLWENWFVHCLKTQYFKFHSKSWKPINAYSNLHNEFGVFPWRKSANQMWIQSTTFLSKPRNNREKNKPTKKQPSFSFTHRLKFSIFYPIRLQADDKISYRSIRPTTPLPFGKNFYTVPRVELTNFTQERPQF